MSYSDLLERIHRNDSNAFLDLTDRYGWAVYSAIRERYPEKDIAANIYNETMNSFYHSLSGTQAEDPLEAILIASVAKIAPETLDFDSSFVEFENGIPHIQLHQKGVVFQDVKTRKKKKGFDFHFCIFVILISCIGMIWCSVGLMMKMNLIPYYDLGYSWLSQFF